MNQLAKNWLNHLSSKIFLKHAELTARQEDYLRQWRLTEAARSIRSFSIVASLTTMFTLAGMRFFLPESIQVAAYVTCGVICFYCVASLFVLTHKISRNALFLKGLLFSGKFCISFSFCILFHLILTHQEIPRTYYLFAGLFWMNFMWYSGILGSIFGMHLLWVKILILLPPFMIFFLEAPGNNLAIAINAIFLDAFVMFFFVSLNQRSEAHALLELKAKDLEMQNERLRIEAIDSEMNIARELQKNLARPPETAICAGHQIKVWQVPATKLGGDWVAARTLADGRYVLAIGDGSGTGVPAAMVLQAVQSLWVASTHDKNWTPESWFQSVNRTLRTMGRERPHTLALGMIVLSQNDAVYYSAGPMPLYLISDAGNADSTKAMVGDGLLLGIYDDPKVKPVAIGLPDLSPYAIMVATNGVINKHATGRDHQMFDLLVQLKSQGIAALGSSPAQDDKLLVVIEQVQAAAKAA